MRISHPQHQAHSRVPLKALGLILRPDLKKRVLDVKKKLTLYQGYYW